MKVLVTANLTEKGLARLKNELGLSVVNEPWGKSGKLLLADELAEKMKELSAQAVILEVDLCHEEVFEAVDLKFIGCCRGDPLNVDVETATSKGIPVFYTPGRNADAVADLTLAFMLAYLRKLIPVHNLLVSGRFDPEDPKEFLAMLENWKGHEMGSRTVGVVGLGAVGFAVAKRVRAFGSRILAFDPYAPEARFQELELEKVELEKLFRESDLVTLHAAVTDETEGMINAELIAAMKPTAFFLNLARTELIDEDALFEAVSQKKIAGAAIDVFLNEPPKQDERWFALDNVIVTPHLGGTTFEVIDHQTDIMLADIAAFLKGGKPKFCANPEVLKKK